jgi:hypothetical protein
VSAALLLSTALLAAAPTGDAPAAPEARAEASASEVRLGEPFELSLALRHEAGETVELVPPAAADLGPFGLRDASCRTTPGERGALTVCTLVLQLFDLGEREVPAASLRVRGPPPSGGERLVAAPPVKVKGLSTTDRSQQASAMALRPSQAPPVLVRSLRLLAWAGALLAALLLALLARRLLRRRREPTAALVLPPHERLSRRVGEIAALELPRRGRGREHVDRLAEAVRAFLAAAAPRAALDLTTAELLAALAAAPPPWLDLAALARFLSEADLVKFAREVPDEEACSRALGFARALSEAARPAPREAA